MGQICACVSKQGADSDPDRLAAGSDRSGPGAQEHLDPAGDEAHDLVNHVLDEQDTEDVHEPGEIRRLSLGLGPISGPEASVPDSVLQLQPGQDGAVVRRRLEYRRYSIEEEANRDELKKLFLNILLLKARHPT